MSIFFFIYPKPLEHFLMLRKKILLKWIHERMNKKEKGMSKRKADKTNTLRVIVRVDLYPIVLDNIDSKIFQILQ